MSKRRSPRLLKKLKLGAFQEFGFPFSADFTKEVDMQAQEDLIIALLEWIDGGFVTKYKNGSTTEEDQKAVGDWLKANKALKDTEVGKLVDAWYE